MGHWASSRAATSEQLRAELKSHLDCILLTEDSVMFLFPPRARLCFTVLGQEGAAYQHKGVTVGTDVACKDDGAI